MAEVKRKRRHGTKAVSKAERLDIRTIETLRPWLNKPSIKAIGRIGEIGDQPPLLALSGATLAIGLLRGDRRLARTGVGMTVAHLIATGIKTLGKDNIDRSRPRGLIRDGRYTMKKGDSHKAALRSFPSGHTAGAVALASAVAREYPRHRVAAYGAAAAIAALQIVRRAHFPTDILAGTLVGLASESLGHAMIEPVEERLHQAARRD